MLPITKTNSDNPARVSIISVIEFSLTRALSRVKVSFDIYGYQPSTKLKVFRSQNILFKQSQLTEH
jgi:hypothetical protein